ncbi:GNAT family N-acetyltransferase [Paenalkalicoccus suaedae]|uniref:GNAT family N-acetyltransferase n=1 Tax=Paenalkalicoccus suaedae TaxID=2592382 RepID=A0A859FDP1_9BACI|nr:GNAT family protein [Paenalkalicoccus suaedae]QKS70694.1 GNAT family N-acetyltransferase [Paenalkalicoccus suaedae]
MITLSPFTKEHVDPLMTWINATDEEFMITWSGTTFTFPLTHDQLDRYIGEKTSRLFACSTEDDGLIGHLALRYINPLTRSARIGKVLINDAHRGKGYGKKMIEQALHVAFKELDLVKVTLGVFDNNPKAKLLYERLGFKVTEIKENHVVVGETSLTLYEMAILKEQWLYSREIPVNNG